VLQPAQNTSAPAFPAGTLTPPTYGSLMGSARDALDHAVTVSVNRQPSAEAALAELIGYERFLYNAANHLSLLMRFTEVRTDAIRRLANRLNGVRFPAATGGAWFEVARFVGAAHDLLCTHLAGGVPRTPEAKTRLLGPAPAAACRNFTELIIEAVDASAELRHRAMLAQKRRADRPISATTLRRISLTNQVVSVCARAAMWDLVQVPPNAAAQLDSLPVALPENLARSETLFVSTPLAAVRLLGQLCHDQARGLTSASPASLRDLALLGVRLNDPQLLESAADDRPLARLARAHATDQIDAARSAWSNAARELTTTVQGITKAPGAYGAAIQLLLHEPLNPRTRNALATTLPALGRDAARTVQALADRGDLVTLQPIPLQTRAGWRAITPQQTTAISTRFTHAAEASSRATAAVQDVHRSQPGPSTSARGQVRHRSVPSVEQARSPLR